MRNIAFVFGTRPEAIKMAPIIHEIRRRPGLKAHVCITSQHKEMLQNVLQIFDIEPSCDLNVMSPGQSATDVIARVLTSVPAFYAACKPDMVLVQGDTATCFAGAVAAFGLNIPVGHVEAGLRTNNLGHPFPEEGYRQMVSRITSCHFAPTKTAAANLHKEGIKEHVYVTGNTVIDSLFYAKGYILENPSAAHIADLPADIQRGERPFVLITGHRRESFGSPFETMCKAILTLARKYPDVAFVYPVHLNPNVQKPVKTILSQVSNVHLIPPQTYLPFVGLMQNCTWILTDSGGIQEEAPALGKPVLVMRETTERPEAVEAGTSKLVGTQIESIVTMGSRLFEDQALYQSMSMTPNPYGDGTSAKQISDIIQIM